MYLFQPGLTHVVHGKLPGFAPTPSVYKILKKRSQFTISCDITPVHSYLCSFSCRCRESMLYVLNAQKEHTRAFFVWTARICESIPILEHVGVMSQFPHLYIFVRPPTLMWIGFSMIPLIFGRSAEVVAVASSSVSSSLVSNLVGVEVGVGVVAVLTYLSSWGSSPAPTSLHVFSKAAYPSATNW